MAGDVHLVEEEPARARRGQKGPAASQDAWDVLHASLTLLAAVALVGGYLACIGLIVAYQNQPRWAWYAPPALLFAGGLGTLILRGTYRLRAATLMTVAFASAVMANWLYAWQPGPFLYCLVCLTTGVLLGPLAAMLPAALGSAALLLLPGPASPGPYIIMLWLTATITAAAMHTLYQVVRRSQSSEERAWRYAEEARQRRGQIASAKKALSDMYERLQRTNHELALARQEAEESRQVKAQFAANISHELRTPLNLIIGFSEMMYRSPEVYGNVHWTPALRADIREIYRSSQHLLGMIDDILDLSRLQAQHLPLRLEPTDLGALLREAAIAAQGLVRGKDVALTVNLPQSLPEMMLDRTRIRQVVLNLLNNAARFTDQGQIELSAHIGEGEVTVAVADTGVGIPPEDMQTIFEEFGQARDSVTSGRGGAGLGLAICRQFVNLHGGAIEAESKVGVGSTFRFRLPLPHSGRAISRLSYYAPEGWAPPVPSNPLGKAVLVIGPDGGQVARLARDIQGYRAVPIQQLDDLADRVAAEHPAGIVLLRDQVSEAGPQPTQVWQTAGRSDLPIIVCETFGPKASGSRSRAASYLVKPVTRQALLEAIARHNPSPASILVVDDDHGFVALIVRILGADLPGTALARAYSAGEALAALAERRFDLVLLDLVLPDRSGWEVLDCIQANPELSDVTVILTTASSYGDGIEQASLRRIELLRQDGMETVTAGRYVKALLDVQPPDYSA